MAGCGDRWHGARAAAVRLGAAVRFSHLGHTGGSIDYNSKFIAAGQFTIAGG